MKGRSIREIGSLVSATFNDWVDDKAPRLAAALSYYTLFSLAPILIIAIAIAGLVFGQEAARGQIVGQIQSLVGVDGGKAIEAMLQSASQPTTGKLATIIGFVTLLIGATGAFVELQDAMNTIWEVRPKPGRGIKGMLFDRLFSFGVLLGVGFLLLVSLVISAALSAFTALLNRVTPASSFVAHGLNLVLSFGITTLLFALIFKILPDVRLRFRDVWLGAAVTAGLFTIGKFVIGLYIGRGAVASAYGAAGSLVALLVWIYYSTLILFLGAEFTQIYAEWNGRVIEPLAHAEYTPEHDERLKARGHNMPEKAPEGERPRASVPSLARAREDMDLRITPLPHRPRHRRLYYG